jgi:hypothetical protein
MKLPKTPKTPKPVKEPKTPETPETPKAPKAEAKVEEPTQEFPSKEYVESDLTESPKSTDQEHKQYTRLIRCRAFPCVYEDTFEEGIRAHWLVSCKFP